MAIIEKMKKSDLNSFVKSYKDVKSDEEETNSAVISLDELMEYCVKLKKLDPKIDGIRIHLIRNFPKLSFEETKEWRDLFVEIGPQKKHTQLTLAFAPVTNFNNTIDLNSPGNPTDFFRPDDETVIVLVPGNINTGLCPPNC
jgi:hypothetical protein